MYQIVKKWKEKNKPIKGQRVIDWEWREMIFQIASVVQASVIDVF